MESLLTADSLIALVTLTAMEIVLGIDNIVMVAVLVTRVPKERQDRARRIGISLALLTRLALLFSITWVMTLTNPLFTILGKAISGRDLILLGGGLFLIAKAGVEIRDKLETGAEEAQTAAAGRSGFFSVIVQIILLDIVFSLDSVITAVGMAQEIAIMILAMVIAVGVMLVSAGFIGNFIQRHPTVKILALSFLLLIGIMLFGEGTGVHISRGYIYFAMAFSLSVEMLNMLYRKRHKPVALSESQL